MDEERTCKTCTHFNNEAYFCRTFDTAMAEWDSCNCHETYEEMVERIKTTQKECRNGHGYYQKDWKYCPICGSALLTPSIDSDNLRKGEQDG